MIMICLYQTLIIIQKTESKEESQKLNLQYGYLQTVIQSTATLQQHRNQIFQIQAIPPTSVKFELNVKNLIIRQRMTGVDPNELSPIYNQFVAQSQQKDEISLLFKFHKMYYFQLKQESKQKESQQEDNQWEDGYIELASFQLDRAFYYTDRYPSSFLICGNYLAYLVTFQEQIAKDAKFKKVLKKYLNKLPMLFKKQQKYVKLFARLLKIQKKQFLKQLNNLVQARSQFINLIKMQIHIQMITQYISWEMKKIQKFATLFHNLFKIISSLSLICNFNQQDALQFFEMLAQLSNELPQQFIAQSLKKYQPKLFQVITIIDFINISQYKLVNFVKSILIKNTKQQANISLCIKIFCRGIQRRQLENGTLNKIYQQIKLYLEKKRQLILQERNLMLGDSEQPNLMSRNFQQIYKVNLIISGLLCINKPIMTCIDIFWRLLLKSLFSNYTELFYSVTSLFKHFGRSIKEKNGKQGNEQEYFAYILHQYKQSYKLLLYLDQQIQKEILLHKIEVFFTLKIQLLSYLIEILMIYGCIGKKFCDQVLEIYLYLQDGFGNLRNQRQLAGIEKGNFKTRLYCCLNFDIFQNSQLLLLIANRVMLYLGTNHETCQLALFQIDTEFEIIRGLYPKNQITQLERFTKYLKCQLDDLWKTIGQNPLSIGKVYKIS